jgi:putative peptidoglycan lipid II flippase
MLSRISGLARVVIASAVLGTGALGGLYESTNRIPNYLFELFAGGSLQAVLIPVFVKAREEGGIDSLRRLADSVSHTLSWVLAAVTAAGIALSPLIVRGFMATESNHAIYAEKVRLGTAFTVVFVPQVLCYGLAVVSSCVLAAHRKFLAASLAPAVNNMVAIAAYAAYHVLRHGRPPSLHFSPMEFLVIGVGTTAAVLAFAAVPTWFAVRTGSMGIPRRTPGLARSVGLHRAGGWAVLQVAFGISLSMTAVVIGNGSANGVGVYLWAQNFMLLPVGLIAYPISTAIAPRLASALLIADDPSSSGRHQSQGAVGLGVVASMAAGAVLTGLAWPIARLFAFGEATRSGFAPLAHTLLVFGPATVLISLWVLYSRMLFSIGRAALSVISTGMVMVTGAVSMIIAAHSMDSRNRAVALAIGAGVAHIVPLAFVVVAYQRATGWLPFRSYARTAVAAAIAGPAAAAVMWALNARFPHSRLGAAEALGAAACAGAVVFLGVQRVVGGRPLRTILHWDR